MWALKFYKKCLEKKFSNLSIKASTSGIIKLSAENLSSIEVDTLTAATPIKYADDNNYAVFLESSNRYESDGWTLSNQLYMSLFLQVDSSLNTLT